VTGIPAVLVPWAASAEDHQTLNVTWLSDRGGAVHLPESDLAHLAEVVQQLRNDPDERLLLGQRAREAGAVHRRGALAELIESVAGA
jgi:UDP-N-acetylglucosamine--N-acetylmuramyl-(pentapeptide) pyrophosphoryl-undecaprenol N-acetylglucosamine transferase